MTVDSLKLGTADLLRVVGRSVGIYGVAPTCHLSALARMNGYRMVYLDRALDADRSLVRVRAMRGSVHALPRGLLEVVLAATRRQNQSWSSAYRRRLADDYSRWAPLVEESLAHGPRSAAGLRARVDPDRRIGRYFGALLAMMASEYRIVRAATTGGWRSNRLTYARWADWLPDIDPHAIDEVEARRRLAESYLAAYGPATLPDLRWWAGWTVAETRAASDGLDWGREGSMRLQQGLRLLPVWDVLMVAHRERDHLLDSAHHPFAYDRFGNATSVVLDGGRVVGVWDLGASDRRLEIKVAPFSAWRSRRWDAVETQAHRIGGMIGADRVTVEKVAEPVDLVAAPRNRFLSPLKLSRPAKNPG